MSSTFTKTAVGTVLGGAMLVAGGLGLGGSLANATPEVPQAVTGDGMLDVTLTLNGQEIGVMQDVSLATAASLAATACPTAGIDLGSLTGFDDGVAELPGVCTSMVGGLTFTFSQDATVVPPAAAPGQSEYAPGQNKAPGEPATPPTSPPAGAPGQQGR